MPRCEEASYRTRRKSAVKMCRVIDTRRSSNVNHTDKNRPMPASANCIMLPRDLAEIPTRKTCKQKSKMAARKGAMLSALGPQRPEVSLSLYSFNELSSEKAIRPSESMKFTWWPTFGEMCP